MRDKDMVYPSLIIALLTASMSAHAADLSGKWVLEKPSSQLHTVDGKLPPLLPAAQQQQAQVDAALARGDRSADAATRCIPPGITRLFSWHQPFLVAQRPYLVLMLFQSERLVRQIYVQYSYPGGIEDSYLGKSTGYWDGDTLVVNTTGFKVGGWLDDTGTPYSSALQLSERWTRTGSTLADEVQITDPQNYATPWKTRFVFKSQPGMRLTEDVCADRLGPALKEGQQ